MRTRPSHPLPAGLAMLSVISKNACSELESSEKKKNFDHID